MPGLEKEAVRSSRSGRSFLHHAWVKIILLALLVIFLNIAVFLTNPPKPVFQNTPPAYNLSLELTIFDKGFGIQDQLRIYNTGYATFYCPVPQMLDSRPGEKEAGFYQGEVETMTIEALTDFLRLLPTTADAAGTTVTPKVICQWENKKWAIGYPAFPDGAKIALSRIRESLLDRPVWTVTADAVASGKEHWQYGLRNRGKMAVEIENPWNRPAGRTAFTFEAQTMTGLKPFNLERDNTGPNTLYVVLGPQQSLVMDFNPKRLLKSKLVGSSVHGFYQGKIRVGDSALFRIRSQSKSLSDRQE